MACISNVCIQHEPPPPPPTPRSLASTAGELSFRSSSSFLPSAIWKGPFVPSGNHVPRYNIENLATEVYKAATGDTSGHTIRVSGRTVEELANEFELLLDAAILAGDFTPLLAPTRLVLM